MSLVKTLDRSRWAASSTHRRAGWCTSASSGGDDALALSIERLSACYLISDITVLALSLSYIPLARIAFSLVTVFISSALIEAVSSWGVEAQEGAGREAAVERS